MTDYLRSTRITLSALALSVFSIGMTTTSLIRPLSSEAADNTVSVSGQFRTRLEGHSKTDFLGNQNFSLIRVRPVILFTRDSQLDVNFTPQFTRAMGEPIYNAPANTGVLTKQSASGSTVDPVFSVHEAYAHYRPFTGTSVKIGRQALSYGDELVIGALDWNNVARVFDAFKISTHYGFGSTELFASKITDNNTITVGTGDVDFYGLYNSFDLGTYAKSFDLYGLYQKNASATLQTQLGATGIRIASKVHGFDYRAEYTKEFGNAITSAKDAWQFDAEAGYSLEQTIKPRLSIEYFYADKDYDQLYPTVHKWLGYADVLGRRNINGFVAHLSAEPIENLKIKFDFHTFRRSSTDASAYKLNGTTSLGTATGSTSKSIGTEADLTASYPLTKDLSLTGGGSLFFSGAYLKNQFGNTHPRFYFLQMSVAL